MFVITVLTTHFTMKLISIHNIHLMRLCEIRSAEKNLNIHHHLLIRLVILQIADDIFNMPRITIQYAITGFNQEIKQIVVMEQINLMSPNFYHNNDQLNF